MHPQLTLLLELQDLRSKLKEMTTASEGRSIEAEHFHIDPGEASARLAATIEELEEGLAEPVRARYRQIVTRVDRVVVPVIHGVCYGCYVSIPTATAGDRTVHQELEGCETCGRFLYVLS